MKVFSRVLVAMIAAIAALFVGTGTSHAGLDNELSLVDGKGRTLNIQQWDTFLNGVFPLDRNRLTREWFHSGRAIYNVTGDGSDAFEGKLELGYQVGFPWSLGVGINFSYQTPNILLDNISPATLAGTGWGGIITPNLFPSVSISADLGNGPGIQEVATFAVDVSGPAGAVAPSMRTWPWSEVTSRAVRPQVPTYQVLPKMRRGGARSFQPSMALSLAAQAGTSVPRVAEGARAAGTGVATAVAGVASARG